MVAIEMDRVLKPFQKVRSSLQQLPADPTPEQVHNFRVRLRQIEAVLDGLGMSSRRNGRRLLRHERPLRVRAGKIHDMDTAITLTESLEAKGAEQCRTELLELIGAKRYRHARKLHRSARKVQRKLATDLEECEFRIRKHIGPKSSIRERMIMTAKLAAFIVEAGSELTRYPRLSRTNLHLFRIRIRHFRRLLRIANQQQSPLYRALTEVKNAIGEWHDWERLAKVAPELEGHPGYQALLTEIKSASAVKFRRAMHISQQVRDSYLSRLAPKRNPELATAKPRPIDMDAAA